MAGLYGPVSDEARAQWLHRLARRPAVQDTIGDASTLRLYRARQSVDPDRPHTERGILLLEIPL
jgi:hypothetical protein